VSAVALSTYLTPRQFAAEIGVTESYVYKAVARRQIRAVRLGDGPRPRLRIRRTEIERLLRTIDE
jgi:excisionase family DNA binding protein